MFNIFAAKTVFYVIYVLLRIFLPRVGIAQLCWAR